MAAGKPEPRLTPAGLAALVAARLRRELDILDGEVNEATRRLDGLMHRRSLLRAELARLREGKSKGDERRKIRPG
jgi:hypothetical protein